MFDKKCYPAHLNPDHYIEPLRHERSTTGIDSEYIDSETREKDLHNFDFSYRHGHVLEGTFGSYDLTMGLFTCFNPYRHERNNIEKTIQEHSKASRHESFRALIL